MTWSRTGALTPPALAVGGGDDVISARELVEEAAAGVQDGRADTAQARGHDRTCVSSTTAVALGVLPAALRD
jgi:hypothetical protein